MMFLIFFVCAFLIALLLVQLMIPIASRLGLVDVPSDHKHHVGRIPLVGGLAMYVAFIAICLMFGTVASLSLPVEMLVAAGLLVIVGLLDDRAGLSVTTRFAVQIAAVLIMVLWGGVVVRDAGQMFSANTLELGVFAIPFTVFACVGAINAMNMADGIDGLAGTSTILGLLSLAVVAAIAGLNDELLVLLSFIGVVAGFLMFNLPWLGRAKAAVFMGDAGSMFLGLVIIWFLIDFSQGDHRAMTPVSALWIFAVPLYDTIGVMLRRTSQGRSPFKAGRDHLHHLLLQAEFSASATLLIMAVIQIIMAGIGLAGLYADVPEAVMFYSFAGLSLLYYYAIARPARLVAVLKGLRENVVALRMTSSEVFIGGMSKTASLDDLVDLLDGWAEYLRLRLYQTDSQAGDAACYGVITTASARTARKLVGRLRRKYDQCENLVVRAYMQRRPGNGRRCQHDRSKPWIAHERRTTERRRYAEHNIAELIPKEQMVTVDIS